MHEPVARDRIAFAAHDCGIVRADEGALSVDDERCGGHDSFPGLLARSCEPPFPIRHTTVSEVTVADGSPLATLVFATAAAPETPENH